MHVGFRHPAGEFECFTENAARGMIGQTFVLKNEQTPIGEGRVVDAVIVDDGQAIDLTVDLPDLKIVDVLINDFRGISI